VVVVISNAPYSSLYIKFKIEPKQINYNHQHRCCCCGGGGGGVLWLCVIVLEVQPHHIQSSLENKAS
jgi:hypothetical protein